MEALALDTNGFAAFLQKPSDQFILDLSSSSVTEILGKYQEFQKRKNPNYTLTPVTSNIRKLEFRFHCHLMPLQVNETFWVYFVQFLLEMGIKPSTIDGYCCKIKACLKWAARYGCKISETFDVYDIPKYGKTKVALSDDEVSLIYHFDLNTLPIRSDYRRTLDKVRDFFVLSCNLFQRHSDMIRITPECFNETKDVFTIVQQKTGNKAIVDLKEHCISKKMVTDILKKYNYYSPYVTETNVYNKHLHNLLRMIGGVFNEEIITTNKINGVLVEERRPKWQAIASHTGRRTGITRCVYRKMSEPFIRKASGHTDSRSFNKYCIWGED